jgi:hypothetical protein
VALCDHNSCHVELVGHDLPSKVMDELWQHNDIIEDAKDELREIITGKFGRDTDISEKVDVTEWLEIVSHEPERIRSPIRNQHNLPCISQMPDASNYPTMHTILEDSETVDMDSSVFQWPDSYEEMNIGVHSLCAEGHQTATCYS